MFKEKPALLISGLIGLYIRTKLFEQEVKKYRMSYTMFKHAKLSYIDIKGRDGISNNESSSNIIISPQEVIIKKQNVYRNLGISALDEASLWYISNNEQELEKPIGG
jgi:intein-encoded DNA endonuclease-like protein